MTSTKAQRLARNLAMHPLASAFVVSLLFHFALIGGIEIGRSMGLWKLSLLPKNLQPNLLEIVQKTAEQRRMAAAQQEQQEPPLVFVEVDPTAAIPEPPKNAKYYSSQNSVAANRSVADKEIPKIEGTQDKVVKTMDVQQKTPEPLQPAPPKELPKPEPLQPEAPQQEQKPPQEPQEERKEGETLMAKVQPRQEKVEPQQNNPPQQPKPRPRTLAEARAQKGIEGPKMKQDGGVRRASLQTNLDVRSTPFGAYDAAFIAAVQSRWYTILDQRDFVGNQSGRVVLDFKLHKDGRITDMRIEDSQVSETLGWVCQRAVLDNAAYPKFPADMLRLLGKDYREVRFTFYYNN